MNKYIACLIIIISFTILSGCNSNNPTSYLHIQKVGMILEGSVLDDSWDQKGYKGLLAVGEEYDVNVHFKEDIVTREDIIKTVDELVRDGTNLIFGHSASYGRVFVEIAPEYPHVHFVYFNGGYFSENVTSVSFNTHAIGFFGGMLASKMSKTHQVGIIAAYEWQPEIEGFFEGVKYQDPETRVHIDIVNAWNKEEIAAKMYEEMRAEGVDVFYPLGASFTTDIIGRASMDDAYVFGYIDDQSGIDKTSVLTSTVQHVDKLYTYIARKYNEESLEGGLLTFDIKDEVITFGEFSPDIPQEYQKFINGLIDQYKETGMLPHEL